ncbi:MAG: tetratricopeptide repeat protein [Bacteroidales bacterium]|nr:tetratricopeptide repeat protein [Bacteroidales bacterium]
MKKILLLIAIVLPMVAFAQPRGGQGMPQGPRGGQGGPQMGMGMANPQVTAAKEALAKAVADSENAKKAGKAATWDKVYDAAMAAYKLPGGNLLEGATREQVALYLKGQRVLNQGGTFTGPDGVYSVDTYADKKLYYSPEGNLVFWIVTPVEENALDIAYDAIIKSAQLNPKGKNLYNKVASINEAYSTDASFQYLYGDYAKATELFEKAANSTKNPVLNTIDSLSTYYAGVMAGFSGQNEKAVKYLNECLDMGFYNDGSVYPNLSNAYKALGNAEAAKKTLEDGFVKFPENQGILVGLINEHMSEGGDPTALFDLLHSAQANEPNNPSLFYVEGDIYKKLGDVEKAAYFFNKATEIDPSYVYGILNVGILYYDTAVELQEQAANELDDAKYAALVEQFNANLKAAIDPLEKAYELADEQDVKVAIAEYLKNIYFRYRTESPEYMAAYEKYNAIIKGE